MRLEVVKTFGEQEVWRDQRYYNIDRTVSTDGCPESLFDFHLYEHHNGWRSVPVNRV